MAGGERHFGVGRYRYRTRQAASELAAVWWPKMACGGGSEVERGAWRVAALRAAVLLQAAQAVFETHGSPLGPAGGSSGSTCSMHWWR